MPVELGAAQNAFGPEAGFIIFVLLAVLAFGVRRETQKDAQHKMEMQASMAMYLELLKDNAASIQEMTEALRGLQAQLDANEQLRDLALAHMKKEFRHADNS